MSGILYQTTVMSVLLLVGSVTWELFRQDAGKASRKKPAQYAEPEPYTNRLQSYADLRMDDASDSNETRLLSELALRYRTPTGVRFQPLDIPPRTGRFSIGRNVYADLVVQGDPYMGRNHAEILHDARTDDYILCADQALNGIVDCISGKKVDTLVLEVGSRFRLGKTEFEVVLGGPETERRYNKSYGTAAQTPLRVNRF